MTSRSIHEEWGSLPNTRRRLSSVEDMALTQWARAQETRDSTIRTQARAQETRDSTIRTQSRLGRRKSIMRLASLTDENDETRSFQNGFLGKSLQNGNIQNGTLPRDNDDGATEHNPDLQLELKLSDLPWGARWIDFADGVSIVGLKYILDPQARNIRRFIWAFFVVVGVAFMTYQIYERCAYFVTYPTVTNIKYDRKEKLRFPTVTICNENLILSSRAQFNDLDELIVAIYPPVPDPAFVPNFTQYQELFNDLRDANFDWREAWLYWSHVSTLNEWFYFCSFHGETCTVDDFDIVLTSMGYCIQFNGPGQNRKIEIYGSYYGLSLNLYTFQSEYLYSKSRGAGFRVLIHDPDAYEVVSEKGVRVSPGFVTSLAISQTEIKLLSEPYGDCKDKEGYNMESCFMDCGFEYIAEQCGCQQWFSEVNGYPVCNPEELYVCADPAMGDFISNFYKDGLDKTCDCPTQCNETIYPYTYSVSKLSDFAMETIAKKLVLNYICTNDTVNQTCYYDGDLNETVAQMQNNVVDLEIYFADLVVEDIEERPAYTILALLCDIGGAMGLILGSTVLTIAEIGEFSAYLVYDVILFKVYQMRIFNRKIDVAQKL